MPILKSYQIKAILEGLPGQPLNGGVKAEAGILLDLILKTIFAALFPEGSSVNYDDVRTRIENVRSSILNDVSDATQRILRGAPDVARADADVIKRMINKAVGGKPEIPNETLRFVGQMMAQLVRSMLADMIERNVFGVNHARLEVEDVKMTAMHLCEADAAFAAIMTKGKVCKAKSEKSKSKSKSKSKPKVKKADCLSQGKVWRKGGVCAKKADPSVSRKAQCKLDGKIWRKSRSGKKGVCANRPDPSMSKKAQCEAQGKKYIKGSRKSGRKSSCRKISK